MDSLVIFHELVQKDMDEILRHYSAVATKSVADRFYANFLEMVERAASGPRHFHLISKRYRRADIHGFPYHFLFRELSHGIGIYVLRHNRRRPAYGLSRK